MEKLPTSLDFCKDRTEQGLHTYREAFDVFIHSGIELTII